MWNMDLPDFSHMRKVIMANSQIIKTEAQFQRSEFEHNFSSFKYRDFFLLK